MREKLIDRKRVSPTLVAGWLAVAMVLVVVPLASVSANSMTDRLPLPSPSPTLSPLPENPIETVKNLVSPSPSPTPSPTESASPESGSDGGGGGAGTTDSSSSGANLADNPVGSETSKTVPVPKELPQVSLPAQATQAAQAVANAAPTLVAIRREGLGTIWASGPRTTAPVMELLDKLNASPELMARILAPFPVRGVANYSDDWGQPRYTSYFHLHEGTDIFAQCGTPVIASANGGVSQMTTGSALGGTSLRLTAADGTYYYYAHLDHFSPLIFERMRVLKGDVLGFVGTTGNADGGACHLHFEIHPKGGPAVPPVPYLDRWLAEALESAKTLDQSPVAALLDAVSVGSLPGALIASQLVPRQTPDRVQLAAGVYAIPWLLPLALVLAWRLRRGRSIPLADDLSLGGLDVRRRIRG